MIVAVFFLLVAHMHMKVIRIEFFFPLNFALVIGGFVNVMRINAAFGFLCYRDLMLLLVSSVSCATINRLIYVFVEVIF